MPVSKHRPSAAEKRAALQIQADPAGIEMEAILDGVAHEAAMTEKRWGRGRLRLLVSDELRARFDSQQLKLDAVKQARSYGGVKKHGPAMVRAYQALERAALDAGLEPLPPEVWEITLKSGETVALVRDPADIPRAPHTRVVLLDEIARLMDGSPAWDAIIALKQQFPGAEIASLNGKQPPDIDWDRGDDIPF